MSIKQDYKNFIQECKLQIEKSLNKSGSNKLGECASFVELYQRMGLNENNIEVFCSDEYEEHLSSYAETLIVMGGPIKSALLTFYVYRQIAFLG